MNTLGPRGLFMCRLLGTCMIIWALEFSFACCEAGPRVFIHLYHYMHWAIIGVPCSVYMNMQIISWVCIYFYHFKMLSNYDDMLTTTLMTIFTFRCLMPVNISMKKASTHSFLWTSFNIEHIQILFVSLVGIGKSGEQQQLIITFGWSAVCFDCLWCIIYL